MKLATAHTDRYQGLILVSLAAVSWGTVGIASQAIYELLGSTSFAVSLSIGFFRLALALPSLFLASWYVLGPGTFRIREGDRKWIGLIGLGMALYQVCYFAAIAQVGVTIAVLVALCTAPVMVALLSVFLLGERLNRYIIGALICALAGTVLLVGLPADALAWRRTIDGVLLALGAALSYSVVTLCSRVLAGRYHPLQPIALGFSVGAVALLPVALAGGLVVTYPPAGWIWLLHLGLVPTALGYALFLAGMRHTTATVASITTLLEPLTSAFLAWMLFDERLGPTGLIGALLLLVAMTILYRPRRRARPV